MIATAPFISELVTHLGQFLPDQGTSLGLACEEALEVGDGLLELAKLFAELRCLERRQPAQRHVEDVVGLDLRELKLVHQAGACVVDVL